MLPEALDAAAVGPTMEPAAPGAPGIAGRWTSSAKCGVGSAPPNADSRVWFTLSHGIVNEVYYPRVDMACIRDLGLIVTDDHGYVAEEKRAAGFKLKQDDPGIPAYRLTNDALDGRWTIEKHILVDPQRDCLLQQIRFVPRRGTLRDYRLHVLLAPHLVNRGAGNTGWIGDYKGIEMLFAFGSGTALALAADAPWATRSAGFAGASDGWQDLMRHGRLSRVFTRADGGNVALIGEIDLAACQGFFTLALGFGSSSGEAALRARSSLQDGFAIADLATKVGWQAWQQSLLPLDRPARPHCDNLYRVSTAVLKCHRAENFPGGVIASLSIPWGFNKGDEDLGGYHLVWPRDLVETAGGFLAAGARDEARKVLVYLQSTQEPEGGWPQNMWLDGSAYWTGQQMDECAFPILLVDLLHRNDALLHQDLERFWPMVRKAAGFILRNGPATGQDRWEEDGGFSPFTLAVEIAALLAAASLARLQDEREAAEYFEETADAWNEDVERWTYVTGTELATRVGVDGYYVRIGALETADAASPAGGFVPIKNRPASHGRASAAEIVSPDALALVRFGLRSADDQRIRNTVKVIDALLKVDLPQGPVWYRYNEDGYGEHEDGAPFDGTGIGRAWPLMTGERAHYEVALGNYPMAETLLRTVEDSAGLGGMLPEQVWDADDIPSRELWRGKPTGSAMPLVWAHSEYIKLVRSVRDQAVFDMPPQGVERYQSSGFIPRFALWSTQAKRRAMAAGRQLRIMLTEPAIIHWSPDDWQSVADVPSRETGFGTHLADLPTDTLPSGAIVRFTLRWLVADRWEGVDYTVTVD
jgi:glucoamylase